MSGVDTPVLAPLKTAPLDFLSLPKAGGQRAVLLSISGNTADHRELKRMIDRNLWEFRTANTCRGGIRQLARSTDVVIAECSLPGGTWKEILSRIVRMTRQPQLVVTSRLADAALWAEVLNLGGYDVLAKPLRDEEVRHVLENIARDQARSAQRVRTAGMM